MTAESVDQAVTADVAAWRAAVLRAVERGGRFAGLFGTDVRGDVRLTALVAAADIQPYDVMLPAAMTEYPALTPDLPAAAWYERELHDLFGVHPAGHPRLDPLVLPLQTGAVDRPRPGSPSPVSGLTPSDRTVPSLVVGAGVFTIPHGPVRSGVFESIEYLVETPGENVLHPQIRVHAKHRGLEKRFEGMTTDDAVLLAERVEGIASVAHALAFAHAVERVAGVEPPPAAAAIRVLLAELERVANHLDVALRLAEAAALAVAMSRLGWHKERVLRLQSRLSGSRFARGIVVPGGVSRLPGIAAADIRVALDRLEPAIAADERELMLTSSFLDRLRTTGVIGPSLAARHGALGPIGRASGVGEDARVTRPYDGYGILDQPTPPVLVEGDAMARLRVRWTEVHAAFTLARAAIDVLVSADEVLRRDVGRPDGRGIGWAEAPQGEVLYAVDLIDGVLTRCKPRSASFHNLVLFHDTFDTEILTDFPFIEASFGLSVAGVVL